MQGRNEKKFQKYSQIDKNLPFLLFLRAAAGAMRFIPTTEYAKAVPSMPAILWCVKKSFAEKNAVLPRLPPFGQRLRAK